MARQSEDTLIDEILDIVANISYKLCLLIAIASYLVFHYLAKRSIAPSIDMDEMVFQAVIISYSNILQYLVPFIFIFGAIASFITGKHYINFFSQKIELNISDRYTSNSKEFIFTKNFDSVAPHNAEKQKNIEGQWTVQFINTLDWKVFETLCSQYFTATGVKNRETGLGARWMN